MNVAVVCALALLICGCGAALEEPDLGPPAIGLGKPVSEGAVNPRLLRRFRPLRKVEPMSGAVLAQVELGKQLFFDERLSRDGDKSCNTCHPLDRGGASNVRGTRNTPTVYNAALEYAFFWDGRAATLEDQVSGPLLGEMGLHGQDEVVDILRGIPGYAAPFAAAYPGDPDPRKFANVTHAIAAFERTLLAPARWDRYLAGDRRALDATELEGMKLFANLGCVSCHTGELVGGSFAAHVGVKSPWPNQTDQGRYAITGLEDDRMKFKVPTLRNVVQTAPYFHDGSIGELELAVTMMSRHQLGIEISDREVAAIVAWLGTLSGESGMDIEPPQLP